VYRRLREVYDDVPARKGPRTRTLRNILTGKIHVRPILPPEGTTAPDVRSAPSPSQQDSFIFSQTTEVFFEGTYERAPTHHVCIVHIHIHTCHHAYICTVRAPRHHVMSSREMYVYVYMSRGEQTNILSSSWAFFSFILLLQLYFTIFSIPHVRVLT
jgi:hypothetical protein